MEAERLALLRADLAAGPVSAARAGEIVCRACVEVLAVDGAGIMLVNDDGHTTTMGVSDAAVARLEELQFVLGEGPGIDAHTTGRLVWVPDLDHGTGSQWAAYGTAAVEEGMAAVFAFPVQVGGVHLGALDVYRQRPGPLDSEQTRNAFLLAALTGETLLTLQASITFDGAPGGPTLAGGLRARIHQAAGMVSEQLDISVGDALARLRAYAYAAQRPLDDVARDVVERRLRIEPQSE